jgi:HK97 family phage major capsid protein
MKQFSEMDRLNAEKHLKIAIPADPDGVCELSWGNLHLERSATRKATGALLERARKDNRETTPDEERAFETAMAYLENLDDEFDRREISGQKEPVAVKPYKVTLKHTGGNMGDKFFQPRKTWRDIFGREPKAVTEGARTFADAIIALHHGDDGQLRELRTMNAIAGNEGGFAVPEQVWSQIYDSGVEQSVCLDRVTNFPMTSDTLYVPGFDSADHTSGPIGAVEGTWIGEGDTATRVTPKLRLVTFFARKLAMYIACTSEVLQDAPALAPSLVTLMRNSLAYSLDEAILTANNVGKPTGILDAPATVSVHRSAPGTIAFTDVTNIMGRLLPSSLNRAVWICSPSAFGRLIGLETSSGSGQLILQSQPGPAGAIPMSLFGMDFRISEKLPTLGTKGDLILVDLSYYGLAMREVARFERTNAAQWTSDTIDMRFILRVDGKPLISQPFTPAGGGSTLSPFVVLD